MGRKKGSERSKVMVRKKGMKKIVEEGGRKEKIKGLRRKFKKR